MESNEPKKERSGASYAEIHIAGHRQTVDDLGASSERTFRIDVPSSFSEESIERIKRDSDGVAELLTTHPVEMASLLNAGARGDLKDAVETARRIGLTEKDFASKEGGLIWWVVAAVVVVVIVVAEGEAE
jgi:hypothetical protein